MTAAYVETILALRYNLFRRRQAPDLFCAAPEDRPVPAFIEAEAWEYAGTLRPGEAILPGFDPVAAALGLGWKSFHLFQAAKPIAVGAPIEMRELPRLSGCREQVGEDQGCFVPGVVDYARLHKARRPLGSQDYRR